MADLHTYKRIARLVNKIVCGIVILLLVIGIIYWIYEECTQGGMYNADLFLTSPKFREARMILLISYLMTLLFLVIIQCCIQIAKDPHSDHIGPRRLVWSVFGSLLVLCYMAVALLAATYKSLDLSTLPVFMKDELSKPYYNELPGNFTESGKLFNRIQSSYRCCGVESDSDYQPTFEANYSIAFPYSCCGLKADRTGGPDDVREGDVDDAQACMATTNGTHFTAGCAALLSDVAGNKADQLVILGIVGAIGIFIAVFLRLFLGYAYQKMKKKNKSYEVNAKEDGSGKEPIPLVTKGENDGDASAPVDV